MNKRSEAGFSLIELLIAMTITLAILAIASTLLAASFNVRNREQARTDSIADVQRAINIMSRELAIGGFGFDTASNGLVVGDSNDISIRVRSNLNRYSGNSGTIESAGEDVKYFVDNTNGQNYLVRYDQFAPVATQSTVLANKINSIGIVYWSATNTPLNVATTPALAANAVGVRITVSVNLAEVGNEGTAGYQPASVMQLVSDVTFRNKTENLSTY